MMLYRQVIALIKKDFLLEWRQRTALNGVLLYVISTVFVCYLSFQLKRGELKPFTWNALFWIILLFTSVNAIAKSFMQEREGRFFFYYPLVSPQAVIVGKIVYNSLLMLLIAALGLLFYALVMGNPVQHVWLFAFNVLSGAIGFSASLTMISAIAAKAGNNSTLMAVLGFPVILPLIMMLIRVSRHAIDGLNFSAAQDELLTVWAVNAIVFAVSYVLFPYVWRSNA